MRRAWLVLAMLWVAPAAAWQVTPDTTLPPSELVLDAIDSTPEVSAAEAVLARAEAEQRMRRVGSHETQLTVIPQTRKINGDRRYREWEADVSRGVRWPGKARLDREIGAAGAAAAQLMLEDAHHAAARRLLAMWTDWQRADAALALHRKQVTLWESERHAVARRVQLGDVAGRDLVAVDAALAQSQAAALQAEADRDSARLALRSAFPDLPLPQKLHLPAAPPALDGSDDDWIKLIMARSHEIGAAAALAKQKDAQSRRAHADRLPDPSIGVRVVSDQGGRERAYGLTFSIPIGGSYRSAEAAAAGADAMGAQAELSMVRRDVERDARQAVAMARARYGIWQRQQEAGIAAQASAVKAERGYALGELGLGEVLMARRTAQETALAAQRAEVDAVEAVTRVKVDAHEMWHRHDRADEQPSAALRLPSMRQ